MAGHHEQVNEALTHTHSGTLTAVNSGSFSLLFLDTWVPEIAYSSKTYASKENLSYIL